ncbi:MAG TPA: helix-turn-helix transcriptional regulator [Roseiflexaceae bacterium]|nr:helix-turn-helix transcriptional regulator [Roseiflexaceae bacterium]
MREQYHALLWFVKQHVLQHMQRFGEKVRSLRQQRGMTVRELAEALGYSGHSHISEIETGKREPRVGFILKVAEFFNVSTDQLLKDEVELDGSLRQIE